MREGSGVTKRDLELSEDEESEEEESAGDSRSGDSGEDDPANQTVIKATNDDSLSLRAQIVSAHTCMYRVYYPRACSL